MSDEQLAMAAAERYGAKYIGKSGHYGAAFALEVNGKPLLTTVCYDSTPTFAADALRSWAYWNHLWCDRDPTAWPFPWPPENWHEQNFRLRPIRKDGTVKAFEEKKENT